MGGADVVVEEAGAGSVALVRDGALVGVMGGSSVTLVGFCEGAGVVLMVEMEGCGWVV